MTTLLIVKFLVWMCVTAIIIRLIASTDYCATSTSAVETSLHFAYDVDKWDSATNRLTINDTNYSQYPIGVGESVKVIIQKRVDDMIKQEVIESETLTSTDNTITIKSLIPEKYVPIRIIGKERLNICLQTIL